MLHCAQETLPTAENEQGSLQEEMQTSPISTTSGSTHVGTVGTVAAVVQPAKTGESSPLAQAHNPKSKMEHFKLEEVGEKAGKNLGSRECSYFRTLMYKYSNSYYKLYILWNTSIIIGKLSIYLYIYIYACVTGALRFARRTRVEQ